MSKELKALADLYAAGALTLEERWAFERAIEASGPAVHTNVAAAGEVAVAIAEGWSRAVDPSPDLKDRLMARIAETERPLPQGFSARFSTDADWVPHPVPGVRMKVLALNRESDYATLLVDLPAGVRFPAHHHAGAEECYVVSGSLFAGDRRISAGDFLHADPDTDHGEIWTEAGCLVLLVVPADEELLGDGATSA